LKFLDIFKRPSNFEAAQLIVVNQSVAPRVGGLLADSDQDGLSDEEERRAGSNPLNRDTDGDGLSDLIEAKIGYSLNELDVPSICEDLNEDRERFVIDRDLDGLNECEERLVGTNPSLVDSDGDHLPDGIEFFRGTDLLNPDSANDFDEDGIPNGDEIKEGTDPQSIDEAHRLGLATRYEVEREGQVAELVADSLVQLEAVRVVNVDPRLTAGIGRIEWIPLEHPNFAGGEWGSVEQEIKENKQKFAQKVVWSPQEQSRTFDRTVGSLAFIPPQGGDVNMGMMAPIESPPILIQGNGRYRLYISPRDEWRVDQNGDALLSPKEVSRLNTNSEYKPRLRLWVDIEVFTDLLPPSPTSDQFLIRQRTRSCLSYTIRNVRLVETQSLDPETPDDVGYNEILIYLSQKTLQ
jgi:hypothetical protein